MADQIQLRVVTPRRQVIDVSVLEVTAPGTLGEFGVLPDHASLLSSLETGRLRYRSGNTTHQLAIRSGFAEVSENIMTVLVEAAEPADSIDAVQAKSDLAELAARLEQLSASDPEYLSTIDEHRWAQARVEASA